MSNPHAIPADFDQMTPDARNDFFARSERTRKSEKNARPAEDSPPYDAPPEGPGDQSEIIVGPEKQAPAPKFDLEPWWKIKFEVDQEFLVDGFLPLVGFGVIFGAKSSFKSFIAESICVAVAGGEPWGNRPCEQGPVVYIAAEGSAGFRKRIAGVKHARPDLPSDLPFHLIARAPVLGVGERDAEAIIAAIEAIKLKPRLIVIDTLAQTLGSGDENKEGMVQFVANGTRIAQHFQALVLALHHPGHENGDRSRGHSSLGGALDVEVRAQRNREQLSALLTVSKLKDDADDFTLSAHLQRVVLGVNKHGREISTLVVDRIEDSTPPVEKPSAQRMPRQMRLLIDTVHATIDEAGERFRPFADGPEVSGAAEAAIRERYYARLAENPDPLVDPIKSASARQKAFARSIKKALDDQTLVAGWRNDGRFVWFP
jgi:hypothetical protein